MKKKWLVIIILIMIIIIAGIIYLLNKPKLSPTSELAVCHSLDYRSSSAVNLIFLSTQSQAKEYSDYLKTISPYNKNSFNVYYLDYQPECELYKGIAVFCYSKELIKKAASCPGNIIIAIKDYPSNIRSSSYMNVISINSNTNKNVLAHELGHALAFLADEYVPAIVPSKSQNCKSRCLFQECFQGCGKENYYRSIDNGIMRNLQSSDYGDFNKQLISKYLPSNSITANAIQENIDCSNQKYYLIEGTYSGVENKINVSSKSTETGCLGTNGIGDFSYNLVLDNKLNYTESFNPEFIFIDSEQGGEVLESDKSFILKVPIIENSKTLEIIKDTKLAEINLQDIDSRPCKV